MKDLLQNQTSIVTDTDGSSVVQVQFSAPDTKNYTASDVQGFIDSMIQQNQDLSLLVATNQKNISRLQSLLAQISK